MSEVSRREMLVRSAAGAAWLATLGIPDSAWALQAGEELVTFTDYTPEFKVEASSANTRVRCYDLRRLTTWATPNDEFYAFHQTVTQQVDAAAFRLRISGMVDKSREFTLEQLKARSDRRDLPVTLECSGNSTNPRRMSGLLSNGVWTGVGLASILRECGVQTDAREVAFLGLDMETEKKTAAGNREFTTPHGRSVYVQDALHPEAMLAFSLNGQPLPTEQGFPLRLILPGWYGMTQIKWLSRIQVLDRRYEGQHMTRNYLAVRSFETPDGPMWLDTSISKTNMKSLVARVARRKAGAGWDYRITGPAWGGAAPIDRVEVQIDGGPWQGAALEAPRGQYAWRLWSLSVKDLAPGKHTLHSRATDANGTVQPMPDERRTRIASGREDFSIWTREIIV
ncbi:MAG TPA: molybdopterin-dependent oxidoreductase [Vicinamibacterales bacterium]|nr:molybdopterin-dependent oxidoreductase [Vicinamibacterales bacterium]